MVDIFACMEKNLKRFTRCRLNYKQTQGTKKELKLREGRTDG